MIPERGISIAELDTPALIVDLDAFEANLDHMRDYVERAGVRLRAHAKTHKSVDVAKLQITRGGACGVCVQKTAEAEALVAGGITDVMISNQVTAPAKVARVAALTEKARVLICVDDSDNIAALSRVMSDRSVSLEVLVEIDVGNGRCGVKPGADAVILAKQIAAADGLRFVGLQAYQGHAQHIYDHAERKAAVDAVIAQTTQTVEMLKEAGLACDIVAGAGTGTHPFEAGSGVYNELQCGSYVFMDTDYGRVRQKDDTPLPFQNALFVLTSIMSVAGDGRAVCDAGHKAASIDCGLSLVSGREDLIYNDASDEHGVIKDPANSLHLNDQLWLIPGHCDPTVNLHDQIIAVRKGKVEEVWPVSARGMGS